VPDGGSPRTRRAVPGYQTTLCQKCLMQASIQFAGDLLVLAGFAFAQLGVLNHKFVAYLLLNLPGSAVLAV